MRRFGLVIAVALAVAVAAIEGLPASGRAGDTDIPGVMARGEALTLPQGFVETEFATGLTRPTAMEFAPDGRLFVSEHWFLSLPRRIVEEWRHRLQSRT